VDRLRQNFGRFVRVYFAFFLGISALVLVAFGIGVAPSGGVGGWLEGAAFILVAIALAYLAFRITRSLRRGER
jgi:hypothetical protein